LIKKGQRFQMVRIYSEPGQRLIVAGQVTDGIKPLAGVSIYVFQTDANGQYTTDGSDPDENARLHGAMRRTRTADTATTRFARATTPGARPRRMCITW